MYVFESAADPIATARVLLQRHNSKSSENCSQADRHQAHSRLSATSRIDIALAAAAARAWVVGHIVCRSSNGQRGPVEVSSVVVIDEEKVGWPSPVFCTVLDREVRAAVHSIIRVGRVQLHDVGDQDVSRCAVGETDRHVEVVIGEIQSVL
jgi:hypothetical protein